MPYTVRRFRFQKTITTAAMNGYSSSIINPPFLISLSYVIFILMTDVLALHIFPYPNNSWIEINTIRNYR